MTPPGFGGPAGSRLGEGLDALGQEVTAWVTLDENILGPDAGTTAAGLNLFVRNGSGWRMVLHHSSQVVAS